MKPFILSLLLLTTCTFSFGRSDSAFADSIRITYHIPELAYAVVSSDSIYAMEVLGVQRIHTTFKATINDQFRIGSNTKTITAYLSAFLVKQGKISWTTRFFDLFPELKAQSNPAYYDYTLQDFITFRANLIGWSYGNDTPTKKEIKGNQQQQRYAFVSWVLRQPPVANKKTVYWSNPSYVAAGLMLEKATHKPYETLVKELGQELGIHFGFGAPNLTDKKQPWGHFEDLTPEKPYLNYKLNWLSSAGNIHISLPDYSKFIQMQLQGLSGKSPLFSAAEFEYMHFGLPEFSFGWKSYVDENTTLRYSFHEGNPGSFLSKVFICQATNRAFILLANIQSDEAENGLKILLEALQKEYSH